MNITPNIVAPGHGYLNPSMFAVHSTDNYAETADAAAHIHYWANDGKDNAVHLVVDDTVCYQAVPYDRKCWQVGNANYLVEGIEICCTRDHEKFLKIWENAADVVAQRLQAHGWTTAQMHPHKWYSENYGGSDHTDPYEYFAEHGKTWEDFVAAVQAKMGGALAEPESGDDNFHGGWYMCVTSVPLHVRSSPTVYSQIVAEYNKGQKVYLDDWYTIADGYVWAKYQGKDTGKTRYIAVGRATGKPESDDYLIKC